jgi:coproporphyrinogen III oxidase-like Fe-S oxidoreductase
VPPAAQAREMLLMGLRINEGIDLARLGALAGKPIEQGRIDALAALGLAETSAGRLRATAAGRRVLNSLIAELAD